ncbi:PLAC8 family protein [Colletotrichum incanum]|nr:PLAC8 family protein [Colletotrichum incanum]
MSPSLLQHGSGAQRAQARAVQNLHGERHTGQSDRWHHGLCGCCASFELCLLGTFLPCLLLGQTLHRIEDPSMENYNHINGGCILMMGVTYLTGFGWMIVMQKRFQIRQRYGIKGTDARDCCASYWRLSSALVQHEREVLARQTTTPVTQSYQKQPAMNMQPAHVHPIT